MTDFVFALTDGVSYRAGGAMVTTARGQVWDASDPFVAERPDIFSQSPPVVHNTTGATQLDAHSLEQESGRGGKRSRRG